MHRIERLAGAGLKGQIANTKLLIFVMKRKLVFLFFSPKLLKGTVFPTCIVRPTELGPSLGLDGPSSIWMWVVVLNHKIRTYKKN